MKFALIDADSGRVIQWQDHTQFGYAEAAEGQTLVQLADDFEFPESPRWLRDGKLTDERPALPPAPPPIVPAAVSMKQARLALLAAGKLTAVNDAVKALPGAEGDRARIEWEFSLTVERESSLVESLASTLGLSQSDIDALFFSAAAL